MVAYEIVDKKSFTKELFDGKLFDDLLLVSAEIVTYNTFNIDGKIKKAYYSDEEVDELNLEEYSKWEVIRPVCFYLIKGKKLPVSFKLVLKLGEALKDKFLKEKEINNIPVSQLYINIRYEDNKIHCIAACSYNEFVIDKSAEAKWDEYIKEYLVKAGIDITKIE